VQLAIGGATIHPRQLRLHLGVGEHGNILDAQGLKYVALKVIVQRQVGSAFDANTSPVNVDLVLRSAEVDGMGGNFALHIAILRPAGGPGAGRDP
jgi:hypothetical protein